MRLVVIELFLMAVMMVMVIVVMVQCSAGWRDSNRQGYDIIY